MFASFKVKIGSDAAGKGTIDFVFLWRGGGGELEGEQFECCVYIGLLSQYHFPHKGMMGLHVDFVWGVSWFCL